MCGVGGDAACECVCRYVMCCGEMCGQVVGLLSTGIGMHYHSYIGMQVVW